MLFLPTLLLCSACLPATFATPVYHKERDGLKERATPEANGPVVDLGYAQYQAWTNSTTGLNVWQGMRYAAAPTGSLRWQPPQAPTTTSAGVIAATAWPSRCPQVGDAPEPAFVFTSASLGDEDCLFLSVFSHLNATSLPVLLWIHGGGYGAGQGNYDFSETMNTNNNSFVTVVIQYRLGAFGFLSSSEIAHKGALNVGLLDQHFTLEWVQQYISLFGGDPSRVTIAGESAGAGSVMTQAMAYGGSEGTQYFQNAIVNSPYLPMQYAYNDFVPEQYYYQFAAKAGCLERTGDVGRGNELTGGEGVFECLVSMDSLTLQEANSNVTLLEAPYGQWAFLPVTDGTFLQSRPSEQLLSGKVNGLRMLSGNNADEAPAFTPRHISNETAFDTFIASLFPLMSSTNLSAVAETYAIPLVVPGPLFSTTGIGSPTALNQSDWGIGQQQRANNLYAETTFVCPAYWLATAYSTNCGSTDNSGSTYAANKRARLAQKRTTNASESKQAWKYQLSVPPSEHGFDLDAYISATQEALGAGTMSPAFRHAFQLIWGRFIVLNNPTLDASTIAYLTNNGTTGDDLSATLKENWEPWAVDGTVQQGGEGYHMLNMNMTGGVPTIVTSTSSDNVTVELVQYVAPTAQQLADGEAEPLVANMADVDAYKWEGGRGERCAFWAGMGSVVPE